MPTPTPKVTKTAVSILANPAVQWGVGLLVLYLLVKFAVPDLFKQFKDGFSNWVDTVLGGLADIFGRPKSQELAKRSATDELKGLLVAQEGDRSLSDLVDEPTTFLKKVFTGQ